MAKSEALRTKIEAKWKVEDAEVEVDEGVDEGDAGVEGAFPATVVILTFIP